MDWKTLTQLATPAAGRSRGGKLLVGGASLVVLGCAVGVAMAALGALLAALAAIYLIATFVLGIDLAFDPRAFYEKFAAPRS
jgi:hypothetical protein